MEFAAAAATEREAHELACQAADPYRGVALGVECAWPGSDCFRNAQLQPCNDGVTPGVQSPST